MDRKMTHTERAELAEAIRVRYRSARGEDTIRVLKHAKDHPGSLVARKRAVQAIPAGR